MDAILRRLAPLALIAALLSVSACPQTPPPVDPGTPGADNTAVDCLKDVGQDAVSSAIGRVNTTIASGLAGGSVESVIIANLEGLAVDLGPKVLACAIQYVSLKLKFDSDHATGKVAADKEHEAEVARAYLAKHQIVFVQH